MGHPMAYDVDGMKYPLVYIRGYIRKRGIPRDYWDPMSLAAGGCMAYTDRIA